MKSSPLILAAALVLCPHGWGQSIPLKEVLGPNNSFLDAKFGVSVSYPQGWTVSELQRWGTASGQNTVFFAPPAPSRARPSLYYQMFSASEPAPAAGDVQAYLRGTADSKEKSRAAVLGDYKNVPGSLEFRQFGGRPSMSYFAVYTLRGEIMEEYFVRIIGEKGYVMFFVQGPAEDVTALRAEVNRMANTVQVP
jgi:hypothetical protein